jgi:diguanylate cyclase (GGDEF)-like protein
MRLGAYWAYLTCALLAAGAFFFLPAGSWAQTGWFVGIGLGSAGAIVFGVRRHRPPGTVAWLFFAAGISLNALGTLAEAYISRIQSRETPFPSLADAFYFALYPLLALGLALLIRRRSIGRDRLALLDALTIAVGLSLVAWVYLIRPSIGDETLSPLGHGLSVGYPLGDVVLLTLMARLLRGQGNRIVADRLMIGSLCLFFGGDAMWTVINEFGWALNGSEDKLMQMVFLLAYVVFGAAALHPSVREVGERSLQAARLGPALVGLLACACLSPPLILLDQVHRHRLRDGTEIAIGGVLLCLLVVFRMAHLIRQIERQSALLRELALVDELTGLPNRRTWSEELRRALERAHRDRAPLTIAMLDLDHFKRFNDANGHPAGDRLLRNAAVAWREQLREIDMLARYGGEEFLVLLPGASSDEGLEAVERLRAVPLQGQTFSVGVATWNGVESTDELVTRADNALYSAKRAGRDRVVLAGDGAQEIAPALTTV